MHIYYFFLILCNGNIFHKDALKIAKLGHKMYYHEYIEESI